MKQQATADECINSHEVYVRLGTAEEERLVAYRGLFRQRIAKRTLEELREVTNKAWVLGNAQFKERIEAQLDRRCSPK
ncbi:MAG: hypothetical protein ABFS45_20280 [Pseudomonadota bacterium]